MLAPIIVQVEVALAIDQSRVQELLKEIDDFDGVSLTEADKQTPEAVP